MTDGALKPGTLIGSKYRLDRLLGQGGMGRVFAAQNLLTGKRVAIKCMNPDISGSGEASNRFLREAKASARIRHPNVVDVYDVLSESGSFFLIMEMLEGEPLADSLARDAIPLARFISLLSGAMRGVAAAHREQVIHRDVKPENIFLAREGDDVIPKVLDFGISKIQGTQEVALTKPGSALGTVLYMAPEQLEGKVEVDARADVYAFGVILYQAITGRFPFYADAFSTLVLRIMTQQPLPVKQLRPDAPPKLAAAIESAMRRRRDERTPNLETLIAELETFADERRYAGLTTRRTDQSTFQSSPQVAQDSMPEQEREAAPPRAAVSSQTPFATSSTNVRLPRKSRAARRAAVIAFAALTVAAWWFWESSAEEGLKAVVERESSSSAASQAGAPATTQGDVATPAPAALPAGAASPTAQPSAPRAATPPSRDVSAPVGSGAAKAVSTPARGAPTTAGAARRAVAVGGTVRGQTPVVPSPSKAPAPTKPGCNPNFFFDAQGEKHFKPECF